MNLLTWAVDGAKGVATGLGQGITWAWNHLPNTGITKAVFTYTANTTFQILEQVIALRQAIPSLKNNPASNKVLKGVAYIAAYDVLPMVALNAANTAVQTYCRDRLVESTPLYTVALAGLTLANWGVSAYTWRQGAQTLIRITTLDAVAPNAFNKDSSRSPYTLCKEEKCTATAHIQGQFQAPLVILFNDLLVSSISCVPSVGNAASKIAQVIVNGRFIASQATPELCGPHKFNKMMKESLLALGLFHEFTSWIMDLALKSTVGMPHFLYYRTLRHLLLLAHINIAAHMNLPLVEAKDATLPFDPLDIYEKGCRMSIDVLMYGIIKAAPIYFIFDPKAPPLVPLSKVLKWGTRALRSDLETEQVANPKFYDAPLALMKVVLLPPILQNARGFIKDPIVAMNWPELREGAISNIKTIKLLGQSRVTATLSLAQGKVAKVLYLTLGVPKKLTKVVFMLSQDEDFWDLVDALKLWFERHNVPYTVVLADNPEVGLHGDKPSREIPQPDEQHTPIAPVKLLPSKSEVKVDPTTLLTVSKAASPAIRSASTKAFKFSDNPTALFSSTKHRLPSLRPKGSGGEATPSPDASSTSEGNTL